jgi:hypothetical protein
MCHARKSVATAAVPQYHHDVLAFAMLTMQPAQSFLKPQSRDGPWLEQSKPLQAYAVCIYARTPPVCHAKTTCHKVQFWQAAAAD